MEAKGLAPAWHWLCRALPITVGASAQLAAAGLGALSTGHGERGDGERGSMALCLGYICSVNPCIPIPDTVLSGGCVLLPAGSAIQVSSPSAGFPCCATLEPWFIAAAEHPQNISGET